MWKYIFIFVATGWLVPTELFAQGYSMVASELIDHPVYHPSSNRSIGSFRTSVGAWGENLAENTLKLRGFNEIFEVKNGRNNGIDRIAIKRGPSGKILDAKIVEVKTTRAAKPKLALTKQSGMQMGRKWIADKLTQMRNSGDPNIKKIARELSVFRKSLGRNNVAMAEVIHVNPRTNRLVTYAADGRTVKSNVRVTKLLRTVQTKGSTIQIRNAATRDLAKFDQIKAMSESKYLGKTGRRATILSKSGQNSRLATALKSTRGANVRGSNLTAVLKRSAGRIAIWLSLAMDAAELIDTEIAYRNGSISVRQRNIQVMAKGGGMIGAMGGASGGAFTGAWIGTAGGPVAWFTVPAGTILGGIAGGVAGYFGGSTVAQLAAESWYAQVDLAVREKVERELLQVVVR
jgi:hypothetical protein